MRQSGRDQMLPTPHAAGRGDRLRKLLIAALLVSVFAAGALALYITTKNSRTPAVITFDVPREVRVGQSFTAPLQISTTQAMNAAEFYYSFPADLLEVEAIDQDGSIFSLWIKDQPALNNEVGTLSFAGGLPRPGFRGRNGLVATVRFTAKKAGSASIVLDTDRSRILANDGLGSKIEATSPPISITVR